MTLAGRNAISYCKLGKTHDLELIKTSECFGMPITLVTVNTFLEIIARNQRYNLRKYGLFRTHRSNIQPLEARLLKYKIQSKNSKNAITI